MDRKGHTVVQDSLEIEMINGVWSVDQFEHTEEFDGATGAAPQGSLAAPARKTFEVDVVSMA